MGGTIWVTGMCLPALHSAGVCHWIDIIEPVLVSLVVIPEIEFPNLYRILCWKDSPDKRESRSTSVSVKRRKDFLSHTCPKKCLPAALGSFHSTALRSPKIREM